MVLGAGRGSMFMPSAAAVAATATLTFSDNPNPDEGLFVGPVAEFYAGSEFAIDADYHVTMQNLVAVINLVSESAGCTAEITSLDVVTLTHNTPGAAGNGYNLVNGCSNVVATPFAGGSD
jgi:hypothetical protein